VADWVGEAEFLKHTEERMHKAEEALSRELASLRTGRASTALVDGIKIEAYGSTTPLSQLAGITTPEPRLIVIQPWDRNIIGDIERAILKSGLGLTPANDGQVIRLPIPPLTEERRKDLVKLARHKGEEGRVSVRQARREANDELKSREKDGDVTEDEHHRIAAKVQELTDQGIARIDDVLGRKEKEIMEG
jgi:ribosome recycling factor